MDGDTKLTLQHPAGLTSSIDLKRCQKCLPPQLKYDKVSEFQGHRMFVKSDISNLSGHVSQGACMGPVEQETHTASLPLGWLGKLALLIFVT